MVFTIMTKASVLRLRRQGRRQTWTRAKKNRERKQASSTGHTPLLEHVRQLGVAVRNIGAGGDGGRAAAAAGSTSTPRLRVAQSSQNAAEGAKRLGHGLLLAARQRRHRLSGLAFLLAVSLCVQGRLAHFCSTREREQRQENEEEEEEEEGDSGKTKSAEGSSTKARRKLW